MSTSAAAKPGTGPNTSMSEALEELLAATHKLDFAISSTEAFTNTDLTFADLLVLRTLATGGETRSGALAQNVRLSRQRLNRLMRGLEKKGLVLVKSQPDDARVRMVSISKSGETALAQLRQGIRSVADQLGAQTTKPDSVMRASNVAGRIGSAVWRLRKPANPVPVASKAPATKARPEARAKA